MSTEYEQWQQRAVRRPDDVPDSTPLSWQAGKREDAAERVSNALLLLPADLPHPVERGERGDALAQLALGESIRRTGERHQAVDIDQALALGATWSEIADALGTTPAAAREVLRDWAGKQGRLYERFREQGRPPVGLRTDEDRRALVSALGAPARP